MAHGLQCDYFKRILQQQEAKTNIVIQDIVDVSIERNPKFIKVDLASTPGAPLSLLEALKGCVDDLKIPTNFETTLYLTQKPQIIQKMSSGWLCSNHMAVYGWIPTRIEMYWFQSVEFVDIIDMTPHKICYRFTTPYTTFEDFFGFLEFEEQPRNNTLILCGNDDFVMYKDDYTFSSLRHSFSEDGYLILKTMCLEALQFNI